MYSMILIRREAKNWSVSGNFPNEQKSFTRFMSRVTIHLYGLNQSITVPLKRKLTFSTRNSNLSKIENWGSRIKYQESRIQDRDARGNFRGSRWQFRGNDFILASETIAKDIALNKWLRTVMLINLKPRRSYINLTGVKNCPGIY